MHSEDAEVQETSQCKNEIQTNILRAIPPPKTRYEDGEGKGQEHLPQRFKEQDNSAGEVKCSRPRMAGASEVRGLGCTVVTI